MGCHKCREARGGVTQPEEELRLKTQVSGHGVRVELCLKESGTAAWCGHAGELGAARPRTAWRFRGRAWGPERQVLAGGAVWRLSTEHSRVLPLGPGGAKDYTAGGSGYSCCGNCDLCISWLMRGISVA